jgi:hypothetical protein
MRGEDKAKRSKLAWQPDVVRIELNRRGECGPTLDQIEEVARMLTADWAALAADAPAHTRSNRELWTALLAVLARRDRTLATQLSEWTGYDDVVRVLRTGPPRRELQWAFRREVRCELVTTASGHGVVVETEHGRRHQMYFADRNAAVEHARALGEQIRRSGQWVEDGGGHDLSRLR